MAKKEYNYFEAFIEIGDYAIRSAQCLHQTLVDFDPRTLPDQMNKIHELEHTADMLKHTMSDHLIREFLPPIEREDIMSLSNVLDDLIDVIEDVVIRLYMYNVTEIPDRAIRLSEIIVSCVEKLIEALKEFEHFRKSKKLSSLITEINRQEEVGDQQYADAMHELFTAGKNPLVTMSWMEIYERLEKCCDSCEDVASCISRAVMNNL